MLVVLLVLAMTQGCKMSTKGTTESFRATRKGWWIFGKEHTALLLHQIVPDRVAANSRPISTDPFINSLQGINSCWYPLERETKVLEPLIKNNRLSELYDMAPTPVTEYAVPYAQLILAIEKVPELRSINDSFKKAAARMVIDLVPDAMLDYAMCTAGLTAITNVLGGIGALPSGGASLLASSVFGVTIGTLACTTAANFTGAFDAAKQPLNTALNPVKDAAAHQVGQTLNDTQGRRKAIAERLFPMDASGQHTATVEASYDAIPKIGWDEMERLQKLLAELGSSRSPSYADGSRKNLSPDQRCLSIPVLKAKGSFYSPDLEALPQTVQQDLRERGFTQQQIEEFTSTKRPQQPQVPSQSGRAPGGTAPPGTLPY
jgi:hypothetical protein